VFGTLFKFKSKATSEQALQESEERFNYCPECGDEFRSDFSRCTNCDVALVSGEKRTGSGDDRTERNVADLQILPGDELVTIRSGTLLEIKTVQRLLEKEYIGSLLVGDNNDCSGSCCNAKTFELKVKQTDAEEAQSILIEDFARTTALDSHDFEGPTEAVFDQRLQDASCPACGCTFVPESRTCPECGLCF